MATCRDVITSALRKLDELGIGDQPSQQDADSGLAALQNMFDAWATGGMFGPLTDVYKSSTYEARAGERVRSTATVTLPAYQDETESEVGDAPYGTNQPVDRSLIVVVNPTTGVRQTNLWDAWRGQWVRIEALTLSSECPLSALGKDDLACCLAKSIADEINVPVGSQTELRAAKFVQRLTQRRDSARTATAPDFF